MQCPIYEMSYMYGMSYILNVLSMKCLIYEMSYLWNVLSMKCPSMKCISMQCPIYEMYFFKMSPGNQNKNNKYNK